MPALMATTADERTGRGAGQGRRRPGAAGRRGAPRLPVMCTHTAAAPALRQLVLLLVLGAAPAHAAGRSSAPNVLVLLVDDMGRSDVGAFGSPNASTPHIDALVGFRLGRLRESSESTVSSCDVWPLAP